MLDIPSSVATKLATGNVRIAWLVNIAGVLYLTDFERDISFGGNSFVSQGDVLNLPDIVRERGIKLQGYSITLSGVDGFIPAQLAAANRTGQSCAIYLAFPDADGSLPASDVIRLYKGTFHSWSVRESETSVTVTIQITSPWSKPDLTAGRITSNDNQTQSYPGDKFFEFAHEERDNLGWGGKA